MAVDAAKRLSDRDDEVCPGALAFTVTKPVSIDMLTAELGEETGEPAAYSLVVEGKPEEASEEVPVIVWVVGEGMDAATFKRTLRAHVFDAEPKAMQPLDSLRDKPEDQPYDDNEIQQALRLLLKRAGGR